MKSVIIYSPCYLTVINKICSSFSFNVMGCGNLENIPQIFLKVRRLSVLGYVIALEECPDDLESFDVLVRYIQYINKGTLLLFVKNKVSQTFIDYFRNKFKNSDIVLKLVSDVETFTDMVIKRDIIGSILIDNYDIFSNKDTNNNLTSLLKQPPSANINLIGDTIVHKILAPITFAENDESILYFSIRKDERSRYASKIRYLYINCFDEEIRESSLLSLRKLKRQMENSLPLELRLDLVICINYILNLYPLEKE